MTHRNSGGCAWFTNDQGQIVILYDGRMITVDLEEELADRIRRYLQGGAYDMAVQLADRSKQTTRFLAEVDGLTLERDGNTLTLDGEPTPSGMGRRVIKMLEAGASPKPLVRFIEKLRKNPDPRVREQLFDFLQLNDFYIDADGNIVAWKKVTRKEDGTLVDIWTKSLDYTPPRTVTMPRDSVEADPNKACAPGLHFATWDFTQSYMGIDIVELRVNPKDVVSVPNSHRDKGRACTFHIERELSRAEASMTKPPAPAGAVAPGATNFRT